MSNSGTPLTSQNPADLATRGLTTEELVHSNFWWHGPSWLKDDMTEWPSWDFQQIDDDTLQRLAKHTAGAEVMHETSALTEIECKIETVAEPIAPFELNEKDYSSLTRLLRVTAWPCDSSENFKRKVPREGSLLFKKSTYQSLCGKHTSRKATSLQKSMLSRATRGTI